MSDIPELEPFCGSWIVIDNKTGKAVFETFERTTAQAINQNKHTVLTAAQYLSSLNRR